MVPHDTPSLDHDVSSTSPRKRIKLGERPDQMISPTSTPVPSSVSANDHGLQSQHEPTPPENLASELSIDREPVIDTQAGTEIMEDTSTDQSEALDTPFSKEIACGITEFVCPNLPGFSGTLKQRYTDFLVNEILPSGHVVHLDNTQIPKRGRKEEVDVGLPSSSPKKPAYEDGRPLDKEEKHDQIKEPPAGEILEPADADTKPSVTTALPDIASTENKQENKSEPDAPHFNDTVPRIDASISNETSEMASSLPAHTGPSPAAPGSPDQPDTKRPSTPPIPLSMQGFDVTPEKPLSQAPHTRIPPPSPSIPRSMRDSDENQSPPKSARKKETVRIRQTSQGWVEVDPQKEEELQDITTSETVAGAIPSEQTTNPTSVKLEPPVEEELKQPTIPSTEASWQAYAGNTATATETLTGFQLKAEDMTVLLSHFDRDVINDLLALYDRILHSPHRRVRDHGTVKSVVIDRQTRSKIHQDIRRIFNSRLETATDNEGAMIITAMPEIPTFNGRTPVRNDRADRGRGNRERGRGRGGRDNQTRDNYQRVNKKDQWAELGGDYLHFSLYKENKDTMESISWLVKQLSMKASAFQFAGTKDRRGVTVQRVSVYRVYAERLVNAGRSLRSAKIGNYEYQSHPLQLGQLTGNEFVITLRDCYFSDPMPLNSETLIDRARALVGASIKNLASNGFINYYGLQRFGTFSTSTDQVGVKMLQGDFEAAVNNILHFSATSLAAAQDPMSYAEDKVSKEDQARAFAINSFNSTGKTHHALHDLPRKFSAESNIIRHLGKPNNSKDFLGALQAVSRNMRLMYVHAYQSLVWNMAASERWRRFGAAVIEGDLVLVDEHVDKVDPEIKGEDIDADGEAVVHASAEDRAIDPEDMFARARVVTREEAESGKYTIFDIVLPTPGYDILYPANEMEQFYKDFMGSDRGGGLDPHDMRRKWKDVSLSGSYRKLLARPGKDFSYDVKMYYDENEQFVETDVDRMEKARKEKLDAQHLHSAPLRDDPVKDGGIPGKTVVGTQDLKSEDKDTSSPLDTESGGVSLGKVAVILKLQLGSSQYATMALRELMKYGGAHTYKPDFGGGR